eukprot:GHVR01084967.1.p1 GENE.GHVR01084967.1~~GHVR01084967.1.p1  ORF type:complete len:143 (+),score=19.39 GHVR01084967.1:193-621(+)
MNSSVCVIDRINNYFEKIELGKVSVDDIKSFWDNCVPALKQKSELKIKIIDSPELYLKLVDQESLENIDKNIHKWNKINPWNVSLFRDYKFAYYYALIGSKILEDRKINEEGDFLYYYESNKNNKNNRFISENFIFKIVISN